MRKRYLITLAIIAFGAIAPTIAQDFDDTNWTLVYQENFDTPHQAQDGDTFGQDGWLTYQLVNDGTITVENGYAQIDTPDFWNVALIRSTEILPDEYKLRTRVGYIEYDLANYEPEDFTHPDFNTHNGYYENGMYFLTLTDDFCVGSQCAEEWWHYHRKMVIDIDNHLDYGGGETFHPVYMVYMAPETNSGGNLLRTWDGDAWDDSAWNWNTAYTYEYDTWYHAELEKRDGVIILRLYDGEQNLLEETTPVPLELVNAMDDPVEYLYLGEPHSDDYEGDVRVDEITLLVPTAVSAPELALTTRLSAGMPNPFNPRVQFTLTQSVAGHARVAVYDLRGRRLNVLRDQTFTAGTHEIEWDGRDARGRRVQSGSYLVLLETVGGTAGRKITLLE